MNSVLPLTYTLSAQVYVKHPGTECVPTHHLPPNLSTTARPPTALPPPPWGRDGVGAASTPQSDKYKIAHHPYSPTATALPPSPCGGGAGGGVRPHTSLSNQQPVKPFTYTFPANVYVSRNHISGAANTALATNTPTPTLPHRGREPFGGNRHFCHPQQNHRVRLGAPPPAKFINRRPNPHRSAPSPVGEGRGGDSQHPAKRQIQNRPSSILTNCHRSAPSLAGRASVRSGTGTARAKREKGLGRG